MEIINKTENPNGKIKAAVFDFDGTVSTFRCGWEKVMGPMMLEFMLGGASPGSEPALRDEVRRYIDESTGIQTVYQMEWLSDRVFELTGVRRDKWEYKEEYNRRLMSSVSLKKRAVENGDEPAENYLIAGSVDFLKALRDRGVGLYLASGTDHADVLREAELLGVADLFRTIAGAPEHRADCSKESVLKMLFEENGFSGGELLVVGDGKVEIALGKRYGGFSLGAATNELSRRGVDPVKRERLLKAGADAITGDFTDAASLFGWLDGV
ncbi:MAG: HAD family hydrolase [Clostridia bacterium]|nr:HAD family hydrolase [Clostridia bacterium]